MRVGCILIITSLFSRQIKIKKEICKWFTSNTKMKTLSILGLVWLTILHKSGNFLIKKI